jgi:hypothetical protein
MLLLGDRTLKLPEKNRAFHSPVTDDHGLSLVTCFAETGAQMETKRREFMVLPVAAMATSMFGAVSDVPWQRKIRRLGQLNMTEHDPVTLDIEQWADCWASMKVDVVLVSVTGILAFYQTKVSFHRKGKYLGSRDLFGDCCRAAKKCGLHVIARLRPMYSLCTPPTDRVAIHFTDPTGVQLLSIASCSPPMAYNCCTGFRWCSRTGGLTMPIDLPRVICCREASA